MKRLLVMSCSEAKLVFATPRPAGEVYNGPAFVTVRKYIADARWKRQRGERVTPTLVRAAHDLAVVIISAKHGPIPWLQMIEAYDEKLTKEKAARERERGEWSTILRKYAERWGPESAFVYGGFLYQLTVPVRSWQPPGCPVELASGSIGFQLQQLKRWLEKGGGDVSAN